MMRCVAAIYLAAIVVGLLSLFLDIAVSALFNWPIPGWHTLGVVCFTTSVVVAIGIAVTWDTPRK